LALCLIRAVGRAVFLEPRRATSALSCCCLLTARDEVRLAAAVRGRWRGREWRGVGLGKPRGEWRAATHGLRCATSETRQSPPPACAERTVATGTGQAMACRPLPPLHPLLCAGLVAQTLPLPLTRHVVRRVPQRRVVADAAAQCVGAGASARDAAAAAHAAAKATRRPRRQARPAEAGETWPAGGRTVCRGWRRHLYAKGGARCAGCQADGVWRS